MNKNTHNFLNKLQAGQMPNVIELMIALNQMTDELYEDSQGHSDLTEATKAGRLVAQDTWCRCSSCV